MGGPPPGPAGRAPSGEARLRVPPPRTDRDRIRQPAGDGLLADQPGAPQRLGRGPGRRGRGRALRPLPLRPGDSQPALPQPGRLALRRSHRNVGNRLRLAGLHRSGLRRRGRRRRHGPAGGRPEGGRPALPQPGRLPLRGGHRPARAGRGRGSDLDGPGGRRRGRVARPLRGPLPQRHLPRRSRGRVRRAHRGGDAPAARLQRASGLPSRAPGPLLPGQQQRDPGERAGRRLLPRPGRGTLRARSLGRERLPGGRRQPLPSSLRLGALGPDAGSGRRLPPRPVRLQRLPVPRPHLDQRRAGRLPPDRPGGHRPDQPLLHGSRCRRHRPRRPRRHLRRRHAQPPGTPTAWSR